MIERGRGAGGNPANRFEKLRVEFSDVEFPAEERPLLRTEFLRDGSRSVLTKNAADDLSFDYGLNPYRGCEHGCAYCYARTYHEYLGFSAGLDFESKIVVKHDAPELLAQELARPGYQPGRIAMSGVTDCYQPAERKFGITRRCLEVMARFRQPVSVITKNALVVRDIDHLSELARHDAVAVYISITTLDAKLARTLEPRASSPRARLETIRKLADAGIPVGVAAAPMIPGLNDSGMPEILKAAAESGARFGFYSVVRLPGAVREVFSGWLEEHFPQRKQKVLDRIRACHAGKMNSTAPGVRNRGTGEPAEQFRALFHAVARKTGLATKVPPLSTAHFRRALPGQPELF